MSVDSKEVTRYLNTVSRRSGNLKPFFTVCISIAKRSVTANFRMGGRPTKWKAHSGWTKFIRAKTLGSHALGQPVLQASGKLYQSLGTVKKIGRTDFRWGTNLVYAALMHYGGTVRPTGGRRFLTLPFPGVTGKARSYKNTFFAKNVLFQKTGKKTYRPLFLLRREVTVPARPFIGWQDRDIDQVASWAAIFFFDTDGTKRLGERLPV